jgi:putative SOS response-associated peptidase YedK
MLGKTHALFVSTGVYEQIKEPKKTSYWFRRVDQKPIVMPGLWSERGVKGEKRLCAAIITTTPNKFFGQYHDRQVCALSPNEYGPWMEADDPQAAMKLLHAPGEDDWEGVPVDDRIFKHGRIETEDLIPIGKPERGKRPSPPKATQGKLM